MKKFDATEIKEVDDDGSHTKIDSSKDEDELISKIVKNSSRDVFNPKKPNNKVNCIVNLVRDYAARREKILIVSEFSSMLNVIIQHLPVEHYYFGGTISKRDMAATLRDFNSNPNGSTRVSYSDN